MPCAGLSSFIKFAFLCSKMQMLLCLSVVSVHNIVVYVGNYHFCAGLFITMSEVAVLDHAGISLACCAVSLACCNSPLLPLLLLPHGRSGIVSKYINKLSR